MSETDKIESIEGGEVERIEEWLCEKCNRVYPGKPNPDSLTNTSCPKCGGLTAPRPTVEIKRLRDQVSSLTARAERAEAACVEMWSLGPELCQLIDGWVLQQEWSDWDASVRGRLSKLLVSLESSATGTRTLATLEAGDTLARAVELTMKIFDFKSEGLTMALAAYRKAKEGA